MINPPKKVFLAALVAATATAAALSGCSSLPGASPAPTSVSQASVDIPVDDLAEICIEATASAFASDVKFDAAGTRVEERQVDPKWLVLVPAQTGEHDAEAQCTIGGTSEAPTVDMSAASIEPLPEEQIQRLIKGENEGGTK